MSEKMYPIPFKSLMNWVVAEYAASHDAPTCPHMDETFTMAPDCFCSIDGSAARTQ